MVKEKTENLTPNRSSPDEGQAVRPPVVVVLGHIDHGKTSLLQAIRKIQFTGEKPGGFITQHIGAYQVEKSPSTGPGQARKITFIDTPGHEAFSQMRSRGAKVADIAVLVVDTTQGVQAQTKEVISQAKLTGLPIIVALNKVDKPESNPEKTKQELSKEGVLLESLGGKVPSVLTSAKTGQGIEELLDLILLVADMEGFKADLSKRGEGVVIESFLDSRRGPTATLILTQGTLKTGDILGTFSVFGKVKSLENFRGSPVESALPSDPVIVVGFEGVPRVGENFEVFPDSENARAHLKIFEKKPSAKILTGGEQKVLNLILKTDVLGSLEAVEEVLKKIPQEGVALQILKSEVGQIDEKDVKSARAHPAGGHPALILGFRVKTSPTAKILSEREKVKIMTFEVIYDLIEMVRKFVEKITEPEAARANLGKIKVLVDFWREKNRQIVGGRVIEGEIKKGTKIEILRKEELMGRGKMISLQRNKKDIEIAGEGEEVGILYDGEGKIEKDDVLVIYTEQGKM